MAALERLPQRQREVLVLRYYSDLTERDIAAALDISPGAVKSHASRGINALRTNLEELVMNTHDSDHDRTAELLSASARRGGRRRSRPTPGALQEIQRRTSTAPAPTRGTLGLGRRRCRQLPPPPSSPASSLVGNDAGDDGTTGAPIVDQPTSAGDLTAVYDVWFFGAAAGQPRRARTGRPDRCSRRCSPRHTSRTRRLGPLADAGRARVPDDRTVRP